jgi:hypothetical protein
MAMHAMRNPMLLLHTAADGLLIDIPPSLASESVRTERYAPLLVTVHSLP